MQAPATSTKPVSVKLESGVRDRLKNFAIRE